MDRVRSLILRRSEELGISFKALSKQVGKNDAYIQQFVRRGSPTELPERVRLRLADILGVDEADLRTFEASTQQPVPEPTNAQVAGNVRLGSKIPVYGQAIGGEEGQFILNGNKIADILAPPSLAGVPNAYAVYVLGDSMEPRYLAGEAVYVNPRLPVRKGDFVVAQIRGPNHGDGEAPLAYVKQFVSKDQKYTKLAQFNPKKILQFETKRVVSIHRIIMSGEG